MGFVFFKDGLLFMYIISESPCPSVCPSLHLSIHTQLSIGAHSFSENKHQTHVWHKGFCDLMVCRAPDLRSLTKVKVT